MVIPVVLYCLFIPFEILASISGTNIEYRPFQIITDYISYCIGSLQIWSGLRERLG